MSAYDWSRFEIFFYIPKPVETLFARWTTSGGLESFFIRQARLRSADGRLRGASEPAEAGDRYEWDWWHPFSSSGRVEAVDPGAGKLSFTFGKTCRVDVTLSPADGTTLLHLVQRGIPLDEESRAHVHLDCRGGWIHFLMNLKSVLEHGIDLREKDPVRARSLSVRFQPEAAPHPRG
jgi:uncharacterized protein YndB with AHSA1/START domain